MTQDLHPGGQHYPNETAVDSSNIPPASDPVLQYNLKAADVNPPPPRRSVRFSSIRLTALGFIWDAYGQFSQPSRLI